MTKTADVIDALEAIGLLPKPKRGHIIAHPAIVSVLEKGEWSPLGSITGVKVTTADVTVWEPPKSNSPFVTYGPEDEHWMRPLGLGRVVPAAYMVEMPPAAWEVTAIYSMFRESLFKQTLHYMGAW